MISLFLGEGGHVLNALQRGTRADCSVTRLRLEQLEDRNLLSGSPLAALDNLAIDPLRYDASHVIVALRTDTSYADFSALAPGIALGQTVLDSSAGLYGVELQPGVSVSDAIGYFQAQSYVRYAQPDYIVSIDAVPNDPSFSSQYGLHNTGQTGGTADADIDAPEAWDVATGTGSVVVAVIDTGVLYTHADLAANIWSNSDEVGGNGIDDDGNGYVDDIRGWDFVNNDNNPTDDNGHGTHVAGIIGAVGNNAVGVSGVIWNVKIMPLKFLSATGSGSLSNAVLALNYAVANGAKISNNSWGGGGFYQPMFDALVNARNAGHIFVAAAGNASSNNDAVAAYPANYNVDNVVSVASTTSTDGLSSFSNYGATTVDLGAPGSSIYSTYNNGGYATLSGTSMATPFVTGAMALVKDVNPGFTYTQVISQVLNNTDPIASLTGKTVTGGRLNLYKAVTGGQPPADTSGPRVTTASFSGPAANQFNKVRFTFNEAILASSFSPTIADIVSFTRNGTEITGLTYTVTQVNSTTFDVGFATQTAVGTYQMTIGPDITDLAGNAMNQNSNGVNGEVPGDRYAASGVISATTTFNSTDVPKAIRDRATTTSVLSVGPALTIGKVTAKINLTHTYDQDLRISLRSPTGTTVRLVNRRGGAGDNFINTVFDDAAATSIVSGAAPFTGTYRPEAALTAFNNQSAAGTWSLIIEDLARTDVGTLTAWSITITPAGGGASVSDFTIGGDSVSATGSESFTGSSKDDASFMWSTDSSPLPGTGRQDDTPRRVVSTSVETESETLQEILENASENGFVVLGVTQEESDSIDWLDYDLGDSLVICVDAIEVI